MAVKVNKGHIQQLMKDQELTISELSGINGIFGSTAVMSPYLWEFLPSTTYHEYGSVAIHSWRNVLAACNIHQRLHVILDDGSTVIGISKRTDVSVTPVTLFELYDTNNKDG